MVQLLLTLVDKIVIVKLLSNLLVPVVDWHTTNISSLRAVAVHVQVNLKHIITYHYVNVLNLTLWHN